MRFGRIYAWPIFAAIQLAVLTGLWCAVPPTMAQSSANHSSGQSRPGRERGLPDRFPEKPSIPPSFSIPVEPLGFSPPGPIYLGQRNSLVSLDFLDENRLLFSFRVPGLMHRESGESAGSDERQIRAVVLALPAGTVSAEALWTVHDRVRYLWMLKDGHFLFRDQDGLSQGDASLTLKPLLHFPGPLLWLQMDPDQQYLVTTSREPIETQAKPGDVASPPTAKADMTVDGEKRGSVPEFVVRIVRRASGQVMLVSRSRVPDVHLAINSEGYIESLRGSAEQWQLNLNFFNGGRTMLGRVNSACSPRFDFISKREFLATVCDRSGGQQLTAMATDSRHMWDNWSGPQSIWPLVVMGPDGSRLARETLVINHPVNAFNPIDAEDIKGQLVRVFDADNGKIALETPASPPLDAGGNIAISPSGRRVAVINEGAIEVFDLPAPTPAATPAEASPSH
jgi:hypothetical protein